MTTPQGRHPVGTTHRSPVDVDGPGRATQGSPLEDRETSLGRYWPRYVAPLAVVVVAIALQAVIGRVFGAYVERIVIDTGVAVVMAVSLNIVNGYTGQFSIGHAAFYAIGGYAAAAVTFYGSIGWYDSAVVMGVMSSQTILFVAALLFGGVVSAAAGWVVGLPSLRLRGDYLAIVTLGFGEILRILLQQTNGQLFSRAELSAAPLDRLLPPPLGGALGFINTPKLTNVFWTALLVGLTLIVAWRIKKSTFGRSMIAIRENEIAAESMGVNVTRLKVWAFVISAFFAGVAGGLYAHTMGTSIGPKDAGFSESFNYVIMVVLGGLGSISGAALAAVLFVVAQQWLLDPTHVWHVGGVALVVRLIVWPKDRTRAIVWAVVLIGVIEGLRSLAIHYGISLGDYRVILFALVLILVMIQRPGGLFGTNEIADLIRMRRQLRTAEVNS